MPPAPPLLVKRPSRLQVVVSAAQSAGALPGAPLPAAMATAAAKTPLALSEVDEQPDKPRTAPMPPSSTQGISASMRVRKELAEAMAREADAPAQYRAAFRAYTVAYQSMDAPVETQVSEREVWRKETGNKCGGEPQRRAKGCVWKRQAELRDALLLAL